MSTKTAFLILVATILLVSQLMGEGGAISKIAGADQAEVEAVAQSWAASAEAAPAPVALPPEPQSAVVLIDGPEDFAEPEDFGESEDFGEPVEYQQPQQYQHYQQPEEYKVPIERSAPRVE